MTSLSSKHVEETKPQRKNLPKPWRNKENYNFNNNEIKDNEIELIYESKRVEEREEREREREREEDSVTFCCEDEDIVVPERIARISGLVRSILDSSGDYIEKQTRKISFGAISSYVLKEVIRFCVEESKVNPFILSTTSPTKKDTNTNNNNSDNEDNNKNNKDDNNNNNNNNKIRTSFVFELKPELVMELVAAAEYMEIPSLQQHIVNMLAAYSEDVPSFEGISESLVREICFKCKPQALRKLEIDGKLKIFENFSTSPMWEKITEGWKEYILSTQIDFQERELSYNQQNKNNNNNNNNNENNKNNNNNNTITNNNNNAEFGNTGVPDFRRGYAEMEIQNNLINCKLLENFLDLLFFISVLTSITQLPNLTLSILHLLFLT